MKTQSESVRAALLAHELSDDRLERASPRVWGEWIEFLIPAFVPFLGPSRLVSPGSFP